MTAQRLRDYQVDGYNRIAAAFRAGARRVLAVSPTGSGKTTLFTTMAARVAEPVLINVHRRELASQASDRLREFGLDFGFIMAGEPSNPRARIQIASVQTLVRREKPPARLIINDEAHLSTAATWTQILESYPDARVLGVTATPWRLGGKPLAGLYDEVVVVAQPAELRERGHLSPYVGFSYQAPDMTGVEKVGDDYNQQQAGAAASAIVPTVVEQWLKHASHLSTVVFAATVEHSQRLTQEFRNAGVAAEHLDGSTSNDARKLILARVASGHTRVLCNVGVAVEGLDVPRLKCCVLARPTLSLARAIQMMGRVRRPWEGTTARIHDHAFIIPTHGLPDDERDFSLSAKKSAPGVPVITTCDRCFALYSGSVCPACSNVNVPKLVGERGELREVHDAEQIAFSSDESAPLAVKIPIDLRWDKPRTIEGVLLSRGEMKTQWGQKKLYIVEGKRHRYNLTGTWQLDRALAKVRDGSTVRIAYQGETINGDRAMKKFRVEVDS